VQISKTIGKVVASLPPWFGSAAFKMRGIYVATMIGTVLK
jgi:hypothetical protein